MTKSRWRVALAAVLLAVLLATRLWQASQGLAHDFAINWLAAKALLGGGSLYDRSALNRLAVAELGPDYGWLFASFYGGYNGPPTHALLHVPFASLPFEAGVVLFRLSNLIAGVAGVALAAWALPSRADRWLGLGVGLFMWWAGEGFMLDMFLGQMNGWVLLGLGLALYASQSERWALAGFGVSIAALLKISPIVLLTFMLPRKKWSALIAAVVTGAAMIVLSAFISGSLDNVFEFAFRVLPAMGMASMTARNQALPAYACRVLTANTEFDLLAPPLGTCRLWAAPVWLLGYVTVEWLARRAHAPHALALSLLIPVALIAGPHTWDHYVTWASLVFVQLADRRLWAAPSRGLILALAFGGLLTLMPALVFTAEAVETYGLAARLASGLNTIGLIVLLAAGLALLYRARFQTAVEESEAAHNP